MKNKRTIFLICSILFAILAVIAYVLQTLKEESVLSSIQINKFQAEELRRQAGLDQPYLIRYIWFVINAVLSFGFSAAAFLHLPLPPIKQRSPFLTIYLLVILIFSPMTAIGFWLTRLMETDMAPSLVTVLASCSTCLFFFALAIWNYRKWGVAGFLVCSLIVFTINLIGRIPLVLMLASLAGTILLLPLVFPIWKTMR